MIFGAVLDIEFQIDLSFAVIRDGFGLNRIILNIGFWPYDQIHIPEDACQAPHVLIFEVTSITPFIYFNR